MKTKNLFCVCAPRSGSRWLKDLMSNYPDIYMVNKISIGGLEPVKIDKKDIEDYKKNKVNWYWIPHGTLVIDQLIKYSKEANMDYRIIHLIRDGRNVSASYINTTVPDAKTSANNWKIFVENGMKYRNNPNYLEIKYEDLRNNLTETLKKLCLFCDIPFHEKIVGEVGNENSKISKLPIEKQEIINNELNRLLKELKYID